jgi:hypothetical protein
VKTLAAFGILLLIGFLGSIKLFHKIKLSSPFSYLFYSGTVFIFFGLLIGENGLNLISREITHHLAPIIHFSLGWVGFIFGFQMELKYIKKIQSHWYLALLFTYFIPFAAIFYLSFLLLTHFFQDYVSAFEISVGMALVLAVLISESSVSFTVWSSRFFKKFIGELRLAAFLSSMDNFFPILFIGIGVSLYRFLPQSDSIVLKGPGHTLSHFFLQVIAGSLIGGFIHFLVKKIKDRLEISTVLFGSVFLISGLSLMFQFSPLFVAMISGSIFANSTRKHASFLNIFNPTEKPIYIIFLTFLALQKARIDLSLILFAILLLFIKFFSRKFTLLLLLKLKPHAHNIPPSLTHLFLPIGSIGPAILLDLYYSFPHQNTTIVFGIFIAALLISEIFAPVGIKLAQKRTDHD